MDFQSIVVELFPAMINRASDDAKLFW